MFYKLSKPKQPSCKKKSVAPKKAKVKTDVKSKVAAKKCIASHKAGHKLALIKFFFLSFFLSLLQELWNKGRNCMYSFYLIKYLYI